MMRETIAYALVTGVVLALGAYALDACCRALRMSTRWVWTAALALLIVLTGAVPFRAAPNHAGVFTVGAFADTAAVGRGSTSLGERIVHELRLTQTVVDRVSAAVIDDIARVVPVRVDGWLLTLWWASSLLALALFVSAYTRIRVAMRALPRCRLRHVEVRVAPNTGPAVIGFLHPEIVLPNWLFRRSPEEQRLVIAHETAHRRAGDHLLLAGGCVAAALMPWHPAIWWLLSRLRLAVELDCDRRVLACEATTGIYATMLIDLADRCSDFLAIPALAGGTSHLERRIVAMTMKRSSISIARGAGLGLLACAALLVACESKAPTAADVNGMDAVSGQHMVRLVGAESAGTVFYVDGVQTSAAIAHRIAANDIAAVDVSKANGRSEIRMTTRTGSAEVFAQRHADGSTTALRLDDRAAPLIMIDGVRSDAKALHGLSPKEIQRVEVLKRDAARQAYPDYPEAVNGVIVIATKAASRNGK